MNKLKVYYHFLNGQINIINCEMDGKSLNIYGEAPWFQLDNSEGYYESPILIIHADIKMDDPDDADEQDILITSNEWEIDSFVRNALECDCIEDVYVFEQTSWRSAYSKALKMREGSYRCYDVKQITA